MPTPTKDSKYSRKYAKEGIYPEAARATSAAAVSGNISTQYPWYGEFSNGPEPSDPVKRAYQLYMQQSEFKKPYKSNGYTEMETDADPPPGISIPGYEGPAVTSVDDPIPPPGLEDGGTTHTSFYVQTDRDYLRGGYCRGGLSEVRIKCQQPVYGYDLSFAEPGTIAYYIGGFGTNTLYLLIDADNNEFSRIRINLYMRSYQGVTGTSGTYIEEVVCDEYFVLTLAGGGITAVTVFSAENGDVATNIPDNAGTGVVTFPCLISEVANWYSNSTSITDNYLVDADFEPAWEGVEPPISLPDLHPVASPVCSSANNAQLGGTWPFVVTDTNEASDINGVGCNAVYGRVISDEEVWTARLTVNCPAGTVHTTPFLVESYHERNLVHDSIPICAEMSSTTLVPGLLQVHAEMTGFTYNFYHEDADMTEIEIAPGPPPITTITDPGRGSSLTEVDYEWRQYSALDDTTPILTFNYYIYAYETWDQTFALWGSVVNFSRIIDIQDSIPTSGYSGLSGPYIRYHWEHSVAGGHLAVYYEMAEVMQIGATDLSYQGGVVGPAFFNNWQNNPNFGIEALPVKRGIHAGFVYGDDVTDLVDICAITRNSNLEDCLEDLFAFFRTAAGILPQHLIYDSVEALAHIRF